MRKRIAWIALSGLVLLAVVTVFGFRETSKPSFCSSCHLIEPYKTSWDSSTHAAAGVGCVDCHFEPGVVGYTKGKIYSFIKLTQFAAGTTDKKPEAGKLVLSAACIQCHESVRNPNDPNYPANIVVEGITFPHQFHVDEANLFCSDCHSGVVHGSKLVGEEKPQAAADPQFCNSCHTGDFAPILFMPIEPAGREHPGAPKIDVNVWRNIHWRMADAPAVIDGVPYDKIEKDTCLACHQEPTVARACKSCHFARVPVFSALHLGGAGQRLPTLLSSPFLFALLMLAVFLRRGEKRPVVLLTVVLRAAAIIVIASPTCSWSTSSSATPCVKETGHLEIGATTVWVTYLFSASLMSSCLFEAGLLLARCASSSFLPKTPEEAFLSLITTRLK